MKNIPLNKEQYSESSKRSVGHEYLGKYYEDIHYKCSKCKKPAVFLAEEQKHFYEVEKRYMWSDRKMCSECWFQYSNLKNELKSKEALYAENKKEAVKNREFLEERLGLLNEYIKFGKKGNPSRIKFIQKVLLSLQL